MYFFDFHSHLDWYKNDKQNSLLSSNSSALINQRFYDSAYYAELLSQLEIFSGTIISASCNEESFYENLKICEKAKALGIFYNTNNLPKIIPTFGIHPKDVLKCSKNLHEYDKLCEQSKIIGEIGMDFCWYKEADSDQQEKVLRFFLEHCHNQKKYCVIHTKDAEMQICNILTEYPNAKPIIHWYDGPEKVYKEFIKRGYMQTFGCETIRSKHIQSLLLETPHNLILAETDNPTAETWLGGTNNSVFLIEDIYQNIAKILNMHFEDCFEMINNNSKRVLIESGFNCFN